VFSNFHFQTVADSKITIYKFTKFGKYITQSNKKYKSFSFMNEIFHHRASKPNFGIIILFESNYNQVELN